VRLSSRTFDRLGPEVAGCGYDRGAQAEGIVHFGIGAFHRAHQAWYTDRAMAAGDRDWGIVGISMRSGDVAAQLNPQDGLYTVTERAGDGEATRLVGAVHRVLIATQQRAAAIAALAAPATRIASFTVTEKGYCRSGTGSLDPELAGAGSLYALLAEGLHQRREAGLPGLTLLSCDNLADNGRQLERLVGEYLDRHDPALRAWFEAECACPSTMVDRIVPSTTDLDRAGLAARIGLEDHGAVMTEPFSQWVIEDHFAGERPRWENVGAELVSDVRPYETAKLRMLNGAHSLLAYCGLPRGYTHVHEAIADPTIRQLVEALMGEAAPTIAAAPGQDLARYAADLIARFANTALNHRLIQIAMDGSQKIPQRWLETMAINQERGARNPAILAGIAAWIAHLRGTNGPLDDPKADVLTVAARGADPVAMLFSESGLLASDWQPSSADYATIAADLR
jgi:fructuronate reductase